MESTRLFVVNAEYAGDVCLNIFFSDGVSRVVDFRPFLIKHPHPQHNRFMEPKYFKDFKIEQGNVEWGKDWDMVFPVEDLYRGVIE